MNTIKDPEITLVLPLSAVNRTLSGLDELPHKLSRNIIDEIHRQAHAQVNAPAGQSAAVAATLPVEATVPAGPSEPSAVVAPAED